MLTDEEKQQLVTWIMTKRPSQVRVISLGALTYIVEVASMENSLVLAQKVADEWLNAVATREREVPLRVFEPEAGLQSERIKNVPPRMVKGASLASHLQSTMELLDISKCLMRKLSLPEAQVYCDDNRSQDLDQVFPKGTEGDKAFRIDKVYAFQNSARNQQAASYDFFLVIDLTRTLKDFLISNLWVNVYKVGNDNFKNNPQTKYEGDGYSIVIPKDGWRPFWSRVEVFKIVRSDGTEITSFKQIQAMRDLAAHQHQLKMFNADAASTGPMVGRPSYIS